METSGFNIQYCLFQFQNRTPLQVQARTPLQIQARTLLQVQNLSLFQALSFVFAVPTDEAELLNNMEYQTIKITYY